MGDNLLTRQLVNCSQLAKQFASPQLADFYTNIFGKPEDQRELARFGLAIKCLYLYEVLYALLV